MKFVKISRKEYFIYIKVILALAILPKLLYIFLGFYKLLPHYNINPLKSIISINGGLILLQLLGTSIASGIIINLSENRQGTKNYLWVIIGVLFGLLGFASYIIWGLMLEYNLWALAGDNVISKTNVLIGLFKRSKNEPY